MGWETSTSPPPHERPHSDVKSPSTRDAPREHHRRLSTGILSGFYDPKQPAHGYSAAEARALAQFHFFDEDATTVEDAQSTIKNIDPKPNRHFESSSIMFNTFLDTDISETPPPPQQPEYIDTPTWKLEDLVHPSGSPVLEREYTLDAKYAFELNEDPTLVLQQNAKDESAGSTQQVTENKQEPAAALVPRDPKLPALRDSVLAHQEEPAVSVAKQVAGPSHRGASLKPKIVEISKSQSHSERPSNTRRRSNEEHGRQNQLQKKGDSDAKDIRVRRKSVPVTAEPGPATPAETLEATREWLNSLADREASSWSDEPVLGSPIRSKKPLSLSTKPKTSPSRNNLPLDSVASSSKAPSSTTPGSNASPSSKRTNDDHPIPARPPKNARPATPGLPSRPTSPPLHRNAASTQKPLSQPDRENWTLYNLSCWSNKSYLKALLRGPVLEFRTEPHGPPFLKDVPQEMLNYFCGPDHLTRLLTSYSLPVGLQRETGEDYNALVFPSDLVSATAIMRIVRYMRRCCNRTATLTKPHFQLRAPPSLQENMETIRACNIFGLYADARRLQCFLIDKKIPGGKLSMEDVEVLWEGYDGDLRDSGYTDALLTHIVYNVLGKDSVEREELMVLLEEEAYAGLRELVGYELGVKKGRAEEKHVFIARKQREREERVRRGNGKDKGPSELEMFQAKRGPMVQGRLLRVLSYDALMETDKTAETRYKRRSGLGRRAVSTPELLDGERDGEDGELESAGWMYQNALKEIKEYGSTTDLNVIMRGGTEEAEEAVWPEMKIVRRPVQSRPSAPTPSGRKEELYGMREPYDQETAEMINLPAPPKDLHGAQRPERISNPINPTKPVSEAVKVREAIKRKLTIPQTTNKPTDNPSTQLEPARGIHHINLQQASKPYYTDEELAHFLRPHQNGAPRYTVDKEVHLTNLPLQEEQNFAPVLKGSAAASLTTQPHPSRRPREALRATSHARLDALRNGASNVGKRQPGSSVQRRPIAQNQSVLRSRADPWWNTLGGTASATGMKSSSKLKRLWHEVRSFV
ncbi:hypothetical protein BU23DRAFT_151006 [Bimuria novae-zelandiae CBS 107.79]|uniref:Uncharacterized protein n=1 Tax=Bimuria novae-zelandiae CBS 107.79 TaxID=1447943 RepID=A0A6A5VRL5_9PLEO|nr:hypothetical protein BU23DRAFT_151006 [Bimuria novae-zelandiae CBS 107.79]